MDEIITLLPNESYLDSIERLREKADDITRCSKDYSFDNLQDSWFNMENINEVSFKTDDGFTTYMLTPFSTFQLCNKLGMPSGYFDKLAVSNNMELRDLAVYNTNVLAGMCNNSVMFRTYKHYLRGILSTRYARFDTDFIIRCIHSVIRDSDSIDLNPASLVVRGDLLTLDRFHLRLTSPIPLQGLRDNDLYAGLMIDSSDVGRAKLSIKFFVYKELCTNGLVMGLFSNEVYSQKHINITSEELRAGLFRSISNFPHMVNSVQDIIRDASTTELPQKMVNQLLDEESPVRKTIKNYFHLNDKELSDVLALSGSAYDTTVWGFANAITQVARDSKDLNHRIDLETLAGKFIYRPHYFVA